MGIVGNLGIEAGQIEAIEDVLFFDFTKVLVALRRQKPGDPLKKIERRVRSA